MSQHDDFDRSLARWFEAEARPAATADVLDGVLNATCRRRPRPKLFAALGSHWVGDSFGSSSGALTLGRSSGRPSTALLLLLLAVVLVAGAVLVGARLLQPAPDARHLGHLAYMMEDGLYVADWDGRNPGRILSTSQLANKVPEGCAQFFGGPTWSPDGRHLAVRTEWNDLCEGSILIADPEGSSFTTIPGAGWRISWSPDSSRIVTWIAFRETIGIYGVDGARQALLPAPRDLMPGGDHDPSWTSDGAAVLVPYGIVMPLDGTPPYSDTTLGQFTSRLRVSPDGTLIADPKGRGIVVGATDGSSERVLGALAPSTIGQVLWSPTGDRIAFQVVDVGAGIVDLRTGVTTSLGLPSGEGYVDVTRFSPEGDRILLWAFHAADGSSALWSVRADGSGAQELVDGSTGGDWQSLPSGSETALATPAPTPTSGPSVDLGIFAPVAGRIVFGDERGIMAVDPAAPADPATRLALTSEAGIPLGWSSDGTRLLIMRNSRDEGRLFILHADGTETEVTEQPMGIGAATISPDGSRVVIRGGTGQLEGGSEGDCCAQHGLYAADADGGPVEMLLEAAGTMRGPTFSPDGTRIAYTEGAGDHDNSVWVVDVDGSNAHRILANETTAAVGHVRGLAWSPAGDHIALALEGKIYTFATDGSDFTQIAGGETTCVSADTCAVNLPKSAESPYWSRDGSRIAYTTGCVNGAGAENRGGCHLAIADADGSNVLNFRFEASGTWHPAPIAAD